MLEKDDNDGCKRKEGQIPRLIWTGAPPGRFRWKCTRRTLRLGMPWVLAVPTSLNSPYHPLSPRW